MAFNISRMSKLTLTFNYKNVSLILIVLNTAITSTSNSLRSEKEKTKAVNKQPALCLHSFH